jgi:hypothetical protein
VWERGGRRQDGDTGVNERDGCTGLAIRRELYPFVLFCVFLLQYYNRAPLALRIVRLTTVRITYSVIELKTTAGVCSTAPMAARQQQLVLEVIVSAPQPSLELSTLLLQPFGFMLWEKRRSTCAIDVVRYRSTASSQRPDQSERGFSRGGAQKDRDLKSFFLSR